MAHYVWHTVKMEYDGWLIVLVRRHDDFKDLRCMTFVSKTEILVAGCQDQMFLIDVVKGEVTQQVREKPTRFIKILKI